MPSISDGLSSTALEHIEAQLQWAYEGRVDDATCVMDIRHPFFTCWFVKTGKCDLVYRRRRRSIRAGQWVLFPPHFERTQIIDHGTELVSLSFRWSWPMSRAVLEMNDILTGEQSDHPRFCTLARRLVRQSNAIAPGGRLAKADHLKISQWENYLATLHQFFAELADTAVKYGARVSVPFATDSRLEQALQEMSTQCLGGPLPYAQWQINIGIGRAQLDRLAQKHLGMTLHDWRNQRLAEEVRLRLLFGSSAIKTIAADLGFVDSAHFYRWVRQHLGMKPGELRSQLMSDKRT